MSPDCGIVAERHHISDEHRCLVISPFPGNLRKKRLEKLFMGDTVDEYAVPQLRKVGEKMLNSAREGLDLGDKDGKQSWRSLKPSSNH